jgi:uncharacterized protein YwgA
VISNIEQSTTTVIYIKAIVIQKEQEVRLSFSREIEMSETGIRERVTNILLLLYLIDQANAKGKVEDELKLQKLAFLAEKELVRRRLKALSYNFFRWLKGPFSKNLRLDLILLMQSSFVQMGANGIELTSKATEILSNCRGLLEGNRDFLRSIDAVTAIYSNRPPDQIKELVYSMEIMVPKVRQMMIIRDIPMSQLILFKMSDEKAKAIFDIDESTLATLELTFDSEACNSLSQAIDDAAEGRAHEFTVRDN